MVHELTCGGAERVAVSWANGLSSLGHDVTLYTNPKNQSYHTRECIKVIRRNVLFENKNSFFHKLTRKVYGPISIFFQLYNLIKRTNFDAIINVLYLDAYPLLLARMLSLRKIPIIMTDHNAYERPERYGFKWKQWKNKFVDNRLFDVVTVLTKRDKEILAKKNINNVEVLYNPLFLEPLQQIPSKEKIVLAVGRIDAWHVKGFDLLMKAWREVAAKHNDWHLRIVGQGEEKTKTWLARLAEPYADTVQFVPYTSNIAEEYRKASIFVLSSRYEGWGLVMIEAMSQGCATIACDYHGRQSEAITDGENGIICKVNDVVDLVGKIDLLISDKNLMEIIQKAAPNFLDKYQEKIVAQRIEDIIKEHLNGCCKK